MMGLKKELKQADMTLEEKCEFLEQKCTNALMWLKFQQLMQANHTGAAQGTAFEDLVLLSYQNGFFPAFRLLISVTCEDGPNGGSWLGMGWR